MNEPVEPEFDPTNPETHQQSQLMEFIMSDKQTTVQSILTDNPDKKEFVRHFTSEIRYDVYRLKGIEAKVNVESYDKYVEQLEKMEAAESDKGKKKYTKDDVKKFIRATCFNKCRAVKDVLATREDFVKMAQFIESILFDQDLDLRKNPPEEITKVSTLSKYYNWESFKFMVKTSVEAYVQLESNVRKTMKRAAKEAALGIVAETKKVVFLQKNMKLKPGQYCSGHEYSAYYKELFKAMYPKEFGSEKGLKKDVDGIKPKSQKTITEKLEPKKDKTKGKKPEKGKSLSQDIEIEKAEKAAKKKKS